jgi:hypothetical protein
MARYSVTIFILAIRARLLISARMANKTDIYILSLQLNKVAAERDVAQALCAEAKQQNREMITICKDLVAQIKRLMTIIEDNDGGFPSPPDSSAALPPKAETRH